MESKYQIPTKRANVPQPLDLSSSKVFPGLCENSPTISLSPIPTPKPIMDFKKVVSIARPRNNDVQEERTVLATHPLSKVQVIDMTNADIRLLKYQSALKTWEEDSELKRFNAPIIELDYGYEDEYDYEYDYNQEANTYYEEDSDEYFEEEEDELVIQGEAPW
jgi:hypothetical protein